MKEDICVSAGDEQRNMGAQPIARLLAERGLKAHDLVHASPSPMTHKMVARACKGRRLTRHAQVKVLQAVNIATGEMHALGDLFTY